MKTITIHRATQNSGADSHQRPMAITLPAIPGVTITADRSETAPRSVPVRSAEDWVKADRMLNWVGRMRL